MSPPLDDTVVAVIGAGAVGCWFGGLLARAGREVRLVGRASHVEAMQRDGLHMSSAAFDAFVPVRAGTGIELAEGADLVLVCVKSGDTEAVAAELAPRLKPGACVLSLQNGVDNAERLSRVLGRPAAPAVVYVACGMAGPGHVRHEGRGELVVPADLPGPLDAAALKALFAPAGVVVEASDNVRGALWSKLILNCAYNPLSALTDLPYGPLRERPGLTQVLRDLLDECRAVADADGVRLVDDPWAAIERIAQSMPGQRSSTAQDLRRGKPTEIDHLNGFVVRRGEALGVPTPVNRLLWALVKAAEQA